jgi:hypothetical protein
VTLNVGGTQTLTASVVDANGFRLSGLLAQWSSTNSSVASVSSAGVVSAVGAGSAEIQARFSTLMGRATVQVQPAGSGGSTAGTGGSGGSTVPAGLTPLASQDFEGTLTDDGWEVYGSSRLAIVSEGGRKAARFTFPGGMSDGEAPAVLVHHIGPDGVFRELEIEFDFMFGAGWVRHPVADKLIYVDDESYGGAGDPYTLIVETQSGSRLSSVKQGPTGTFNRQAGPAIEVGRWYRVRNRITADGVTLRSQVWLDGVQIQDVSMPWVHASASFDSFKIEPVYGGFAPGTQWDVPATQYLYFDNVTVSGR